MDMNVTRSFLLSAMYVQDVGDHRPPNILIVILLSFHTILK